MIDHDAHRKIPARWFRILSALIFVGACASSALAQQKPLLTEDVDIVRPGVIRIEVGFDFLQDQKFTLSGLRGDLTKIDQALGIGTNTTNFYGMVTAGKKFHKDKLNLFGNVGLGILQAPLDRFTQNDVLLYGLAGIYSVSDKLNLVGEVNGFHSTRNHAPLGTEDFSTARLGAQIKALGLRWNAAGVFGLSDRAPKTGLSLGITYDWDAFTPVK